MPQPPIDVRTPGRGTRSPSDTVSYLRNSRTTDRLNGSSSSKPRVLPPAQAAAVTSAATGSVCSDVNFSAGIGLSCVQSHRMAGSGDGAHIASASRGRRSDATGWPPYRYTSSHSAPGAPACIASRTSTLRPSFVTYCSSRSVEPVNSSAHMKRCGRTCRAASHMAAATCSGVPCALSRRKAAKSEAMRRTYAVMCRHSQGESAGRSPYRSFTQSPQITMSRRMYGVLAVQSGTSAAVGAGNSVTTVHVAPSSSSSPLPPPPQLSSAALQAAGVSKRTTTEYRCFRASPPP
mmetsp:Transcript_8424/g.29939  ORF Transcript_8424/g.29939 Transcript_8424/m.29939 type:complete len:291 (+) Transcript_8424:2738-3610(+)